LLSAIQLELHPKRKHVRQTFIIEQFFAALNARDWNRAARFCTPELVVRPLSAPAVALVGFPSGLLTYRALMEQRFSALPDYTFEEVQVFRRPVGVAVRYMSRWEDRAGVVHHLAGSQHFRFDGGRIAQIEGAF
jgi:predicted ester cyclase